jgi:hypothetical protein
MTKQPTLKQLQAENKRLKQMRSKLNQMEKDNEDRRKLAKLNKKLSNDIKFRKSKKLTDKATKIVGTAGIKSGKALSKAGIKAFKGIQRYGKFLEEQERKQRMKNRKLKTVKRTKSAKKTGRRK